MINFLLIIIIFQIIINYLLILTSFINNNFLNNYFGNNNIKIANSNNTKIQYIFSNSNNFLYFSIINQYNRMTYTVNIAYKIRFILIAKVFIAQLYNFSSLKVDKLYIIQLIIYKFEL